MCLAALAPGTMGPSREVVRKILFSQTIGEEWPRPAIGVFHAIFLSAPHSIGRSFPRKSPGYQAPSTVASWSPRRKRGAAERQEQAKEEVEDHC